MYNTENLSFLTDKELTKFDDNFIFFDATKSKIDITHRRILKFILGVTRSCPNMTIYGESGETLISLKSYRLTLNFWHRVTNLPNTSLAKKALLENITLRTNWIKTIEKLINTFNLADKIGNQEKFKKATKFALEDGFRKWWKNNLNGSDSSRLLFYKKIKSDFKMENYLNTLGYQQRRYISKLRCSDHTLEIEKGRHKKGNMRLLPHERLCTLCKNGEVENEEHFLLRCEVYYTLKTKYHLENVNEALTFFTDNNIRVLGKYLAEAFETRQNKIDMNKGRGEGGGE